MNNYIIIDKKIRNNRYKRLKKYKDRNFILKSDINSETEQVFITAFNEKNLRKRYEFIYDYMFNYLSLNLCSACDFKDNKCVANRLGKSAHKEYGCCYLNHKGVCKYLKNKECSKPNISCKMFMCEYVEKSVLGFKSIPKNYFLFNFFFNRKQKNILQRSYGKSREEIIVNLLNNK